MRVIIAFIFILIPKTIISQSITDPFTGGIEIGIGLSSVARIDYGLENIEFLPFQLGLVTNKYLSNQKFVEIGILYGRRTVKLSRLKDENLRSPILSLNYIDFPIKIYFDKIKLVNKYYEVYCGLFLSYLIFPSTYSSSALKGPTIDNSSYRKANMSLVTGLSKKIDNNRIKLQLSTAIISVYKNGAVSNNPYYNQNEIGRVFPMTIIVSYGYIFN